MSFSIGVMVALLLSGLAIAAVAWPLLKKGPAPVLIEDDRLTELLHRKEQVLTSIKDLEFDYRVGKMSEADYQQFDQRLRRQAIGIMQQIEQMAPENAGLDDALEREIQRRRKVQMTPSTPVVDATIESEIARRRRHVASAAAPKNGAVVRYCTICGAPIAAHHKFCAQCGTVVEVEGIATTTEQP